jgi:hypothetical protein
LALQSGFVLAVHVDAQGVVPRGAGGFTLSMYTGTNSREAGDVNIGAILAHALQLVEERGTLCPQYRGVVQGDSPGSIFDRELTASPMTVNSRSTAERTVRVD